MEEILNSQYKYDSQQYYIKRKADVILQRNGFMLSLTLKNKWIA